MPEHLPLHFVVCDACRSAGASSAEGSALRRLAAVTGDFLRALARTAHAATAHAGRTDTNVHDVMYALAATASPAGPTTDPVAALLACAAARRDRRVAVTSDWPPPPPSSTIQQPPPAAAEDPATSSASALPDHFPRFLPPYPPAHTYLSSAPQPLVHRTAREHQQRKAQARVEAQAALGELQLCLAAPPAPEPLFEDPKPAAGAAIPPPPSAPSAGRHSGRRPNAVRRIVTWPPRRDAPPLQDHFPESLHRTETECQVQPLIESRVFATLHGLLQRASPSSHAAVPSPAAPKLDALQWSPGQAPGAHLIFFLDEAGTDLYEALDTSSLPPTWEALRQAFPNDWPALRAGDVSAPDWGKQPRMACRAWLRAEPSVALSAVVYLYPGGLRDRVPINTEQLQRMYLERLMALAGLSLAEVFLQSEYTPPKGGTAHCALLAVACVAEEGKLRQSLGPLPLALAKAVARRLALLFCDRLQKRLLMGLWSAGHTGLMDLEAELQRVTAKRRRCLQILEASA